MKKISRDKWAATQLTDAKLEVADMTGATLTNTNLTGANLTNAILTQKQIGAARLCHTRLPANIPPSERFEDRDCSSPSFGVLGPLVMKSQQDFDDFKAMLKEAKDIGVQT